MHRNFELGYHCASYGLKRWMEEIGTAKARSWRKTWEQFCSIRHHQSEIEDAGAKESDCSLVKQRRDAQEIEEVSTKIHRYEE